MRGAHAHVLAYVLLAYVGVYVAARLVGTERDPLVMALSITGFFFSQERRRGISVAQHIGSYNALQNDAVTGQEQRNASYSSLVNSYYELATTFYEWGWGHSFHFAHRRRGETFTQSLKRHEYYLAGRLGVSAGAKLLDCGCGIGGPARNICEFTQAHVTGVTINEFQVQRGNEHNRRLGLDHLCRLVQGDFHHLPFPNESFDGVYAIEATCHAPVREVVFAEIFRVLKPGAVFACYEWCLTDLYDPENADHRRIKKEIEEGDGLPDMVHTSRIDEAVRNVGFEIVETRDCALESHAGGDPWWLPLWPSYNVLSQRFQFTPIGMWLTTWALRLLELLRLAPAGTAKVQTMLQHGAIGCSQGGNTGVFTPMYLVVVRKPASGAAPGSGAASASRTPKRRSTTPSRRA